MKITKLFVALATVIGLSACSSQEKAVGDGTADFVFTNGVVYTVDAANPEAEAVAVSGNQIVFVGSG